MVNRSGVFEHFQRRAANYETYSTWCKDPELYRLCTEVLADMVRDLRCLDVGGGSGWLARQDAVCSERRWYVLDIAPRMLSASGGRVTSVIGDAESLPFLANTFGHVVARSLLHYVEAAKLIREARRVLMRRGHFVLVQKIGAWNSEDQAWHDALYALRLPLGRRIWKMDELGNIVGENGFRVLRQQAHRERRRLRLDKWLSRDNTIAPESRGRILALVRGAPASVRREINLEISEDEIAYDRFWAVLIARPDTGESPLARPVVSMIIERSVNGMDCILLQKRKKRYEEPSLYGVWELPQGKLESGQTIMAGVAAEISEETGLECGQQACGTEIDSGGVESVRPLICTRVLGPGNFLGLALVVRASGTPSSVDVEREHSWIPVRQLRNLLANEPVFPLNRPMLESYLRALGE